MAKGIKKISAVKKQLITDLTVSSISTADRGAGNGCRIELIKRDPVLTAIDRAFADHWLSVDAAFAESMIDGTGGAGFDRRAARLRKKLDARLRKARQGAEVRSGDPADDRPSLSTGADLADVESDGAFAERENASPGMSTPEGDDFALSPNPSDGSSDRLGPTARQRYERMQKEANAQRRDRETDAMALSRWINDTPAGRSAYLEDRHASLTKASKVYRRGSRDAASPDTGCVTDDDDLESAADPMPAEDQIDYDDDPEAVYRTMMRKAEEFAVERGITQAQAFEKLLVAREPGLRSLVKSARGGDGTPAVQRPHNSTVRRATRPAV
jgi:hypothetical protein